MLPMKNRRSAWYDWLPCEVEGKGEICRVVLAQITRVLQDLSGHFLVFEDLLVFLTVFELFPIELVLIVSRWRWRRIDSLLRILSLLIVCVFLSFHLLSLASVTIQRIVSSDVWIESAVIHRLFLWLVVWVTSFRVMRERNVFSELVTTILHDESFVLFT